MSNIDLETGLQLQVKRVAESLKYTFDFSGLMEDGDSILSVGTPSAEKRNNVLGSLDLTMGTTGHDAGAKATVIISGGTHDEFYNVCVPVTTSTGNIHVVSGVIYVYNIC